jgi:hypothetical protein
MRGRRERSPAAQKGKDVDKVREFAGGNGLLFYGFQEGAHLGPTYEAFKARIASNPEDVTAPLLLQKEAVQPIKLQGWPLKDAVAMAWKMLRDNDPAVANPYGPACAIRVEDAVYNKHGWLFFGNLPIVTKGKQTHDC